MLYDKMNVVGEYKNIKEGEFYGDKSFYFIFMGWGRTSFSQKKKERFYGRVDTGFLRFPGRKVI